MNPRAEKHVLLYQKIMEVILFFFNRPIVPPTQSLSLLNLHQSFLPRLNRTKLHK
jgi:hypothetical protein